MARYLELAEEAMREIRARRGLEKTGDGLPWPGYNSGKQFCCQHCGAHFDTSVGIAKHEVNGCAPERSATPRQPVRDLPSCPACGSYALHREASGHITCLTCEATS
jgi:hypothetical protein